MKKHICHAVLFGFGSEVAYDDCMYEILRDGTRRRRRIYIFSLMSVGLFPLEAVRRLVKTTSVIDDAENLDHRQQPTNADRKESQCRETSPS